MHFISSHAVRRWTTSEEFGLGREQCSEFMIHPTLKRPPCKPFLETGKKKAWKSICHWFHHKSLSTAFPLLVFQMRHLSISKKKINAYKIVNRCNSTWKDYLQGCLRLTSKEMGFLDSIRESLNVPSKAFLTQGLMEQGEMGKRRGWGALLPSWALTHTVPFGRQLYVLLVVD